MTDQQQMTKSEIEHRRKIELIFAQACADSLKETADAILAIEDGESRKRAAEAHGAAFASAFVLVSRYFTGGAEPTERPAPLGEQQAHAAPSNSAGEAAPQFE